MHLFVVEKSHRAKILTAFSPFHLKKLAPLTLFCMINFHVSTKNRLLYCWTVRFRNNLPNHQARFSPYFAIYQRIASNFNTDKCRKYYFASFFENNPNSIYLLNPFECVTHLGKCLDSSDVYVTPELACPGLDTGFQASRAANPGHRLICETLNSFQDFPPGCRSTTDHGFC